MIENNLQDLLDMNICVVHFPYLFKCTFKCVLKFTLK